MSVEGVLEQPLELRVAAALLDVAGNGVTHHPGDRPALDLGEGSKPLGQLGVEPEEDVLRLSRDIKISRRALLPT